MPQAAVPTAPPLDLTTPFKYPLRNEITDTFGNT